MDGVPVGDPAKSNEIWRLNHPRFGSVTAPNNHGRLVHKCNWIRKLRHQMTTEFSSQRDRIFRFGSFELSEREGELRKNGVRIKLQEHPLRVLLELASNSGRLVTREELQQKLWPADTFVDFDVGVNTAIRKLRQALGDEAENPRFIETLAKRGYRFVAPVTATALSVEPARSIAETTAPATETEAVALSSESTVAFDSGSQPVTPLPLQAVRKTFPHIARLSYVAAAVVALAALAVVVVWWRSPPAAPVVESVTQLTDDGVPKLGRLVTDGSRVYFNEGSALSFKIVQVAVTGGPTAVIPITIPSPWVEGLTREGSALLVTAGWFGDTVRENLWTVPLPAGQPRRLGGLDARSSSFSPDGRILFAKGGELYLAEHDGSNPRRLVSIDGIIGRPSLSPDGRQLSFTRNSQSSPPSLFEANSDGSGVRPMLDTRQNSDVCCAEWTPDGKYLVFSKSSGSIWDIYVLPLQSGLSSRSQEPVRLTNGPLSYSGVVPSRDGKQIFAIGTLRRGELVRYDGKSRQFLPFLSGISAIDPTFSTDGKWVAYITYPDHSLWRSRADGADRLQLTYPPVRPIYPFISPDGKRVAFSTTVGDVYIVSMDGGPPQRIFEKNGSTATWSPDGNRLVVTSHDATDWELATYDLRSGRLSPLPSSRGLSGAQWLTQETLVALAKFPRRLVSFDLRTQKQSDLILGTVVNWAMSPDYKYLYYTTGGAEPEALRLRLADQKVETITSLKDLYRVTDRVDGNSQISVTADSSAVFTRDTGTQEIYAFTVKWP